MNIEEGSTIRDVVEKVIDDWGEDAKRLIMDQNKISGNLIILLNMKDVTTLGGVDFPVKTGDEVAILPHVQGG